jgi:hypothetical protein
MFWSQSAANAIAVMRLQMRLQAKPKVLYRANPRSIMTGESFDAEYFSDLRIHFDPALRTKRGGF